MADVSDAFTGVEEAAKSLADFASRFAFPCREKDLASVARESADSIGLKALARRQSGGAEAYMQWANSNIPKMAKSARYVINQEQYDILVRRTVADLLRAWREASPGRTGKLSFGAASRIVDLLFMSIDESQSCRHDLVRRFLHVPLDASTLRPLRQLIDELVDVDFAIEIPATIPSGFIATEEQYVLFQGAISSLARRAGTPPILYAHWCTSA